MTIKQQPRRDMNGSVLGGGLNDWGFLKKGFKTYL